MLTWTERFVRENNVLVPFYWLLYDVQYLLEDEIDSVDFFIQLLIFFIGLLKVIKSPKNDFMFDL